MLYTQCTVSYTSGRDDLAQNLALRHPLSDLFALPTFRALPVGGSAGS